MRQQSMSYGQAGSSPYLSIVVPAYNEEGRIIPSLEEIVAYLGRQGYSWELLVVDDGSTDATPERVEAFAGGWPNVRLIRAPHLGKGGAVRRGMLEATGSHRFLCDADLSMPIEQLERLLEPLRSGYDVAIGSREAAGARRIGEPWPRHLLGRGFNWLVRLLVVPGIQDTQCGFKGFTAQAAQRLFHLQTLNGFAFDVEVLFLARKSGMAMAEVPIDWYYHGHSKVRPLKESFHMLGDALKIRWRHWRGRYGVLERG